MCPQAQGEKKDGARTVRDREQAPEADYSNACSSLTGSSSSSTCALTNHHEEDQSVTRSRRATPPDHDQSPPDGSGPQPDREHGSGNRNNGSGDRSSNASSHNMATATRRASASTAFASLTNPKNFVSLNGIDYVKLDVLGRGGSSKVFRVLSENGQVSRHK